MIKFLFFDWREIESAPGFTRVFEPPTKDAANPVFIPDAPWENGSMSLYGSVVKAPDRPFQLWYSSGGHLCYAESDDGLSWIRPRLDRFPMDGQPTNRVFERPHGAAVIFDPTDPHEDWRYKLLAGAAPSSCICAFHSPDGIRWESAVRTRRSSDPFPVIGTNPDCPIGFLRTVTGQYVAYHRWPHYHRRVCRSESWDFLTWTNERRMVLEPDAGDPPQVQFYGMGVAPYGSYELGTLWTYHTIANDMDPQKMVGGYQQAELAYSRSGWAWHRAAQGTPFIPHGESGTWEQGSLQCASQPVFLEDEIRYYYAASTAFHGSRRVGTVGRGGLGVARLKPDRFFALVAGDAPAELTTYVFDLKSTDVYVNARTGSSGRLRVELLDVAGQPIPGFTEADCTPISGDSLRHRARWRGDGQTAAPIGQRARLRLTARDASLYSIYVTEPGEVPVYHRFEAARP